jgi:hypothetical protein
LSVDRKAFQHDKGWKRMLTVRGPRRFFNHRDGGREGYQDRSTLQEISVNGFMAADFHSLFVELKSRFEILNIVVVAGIVHEHGQPELEGIQESSLYSVLKCSLMPGSDY